MSFLDDLTSAQKTALILTLIIVGAAVIRPELAGDLLNLWRDILDKDEVWEIIEDYIDQGLGGSPWQTEKPYTFGVGVLTVSGTDYYYMINGSTGKLNDYSTSAPTLINRVMGNASGYTSVLFRDGTYSNATAAQIDVPDNIVIEGTSDKSVIFDNIYFNLTRDVDGGNATFRNFRIIGDDLGFGIDIEAHGCTVSNILMENIEATLTRTGATRQEGSFTLEADESGIIDNVRGYNLKSIDGTNNGFVHWEASETGTNLIKNIWWTNCEAINSNKVGTGWNWVAGFLVGEGTSSLTVENIYMTGCTASGSWESGFHVEGLCNKINVNYINCLSYDNGWDKVGPTYAYGFIIDSGMSAVGCKTWNNWHAGYRVNRDTVAVPSTDYATYITDCEDNGSATQNLYVSGGNTPLFINHFIAKNSGARPCNFYQTSNVYVEELYIFDPTGSGQACFVAEEVTNSSFEHYFINSGAGAGNFILVYYTGCNNTRISGEITAGPSIPSNARGLQLNDCRNILIDDMYIDIEGTAGIQASGTLVNCRVRDTIIEDTSGNGLTYGIRGNGELIVDALTVDVRDASILFDDCVFQNHKS